MGHTCHIATPDLSGAYMLHVFLAVVASRGTSHIIPMDTPGTGTCTMACDAPKFASGSPFGNNAVRPTAVGMAHYLIRGKE